MELQFPHKEKCETEKLNMKKKILLGCMLGLVTSSIYAIPAVTYSPYIDFTINANWTTTPPSPTNFAATAAAAGTTHLRLAFVTDAGSTCTPAWGGSTNFYASSKVGTPSGVAQVKVALPAANVFYTISFGGATGVDLSKICSQADLIAAYKAVVATYGSAKLEGLDFDMENSSVNVSKIVAAIKALQNDPCCNTLKYSFTVPTLPNALGDFGKTAATLAKQSGVQFQMNIMAMDYGPAFDPADMGAYAVQAANTLHSFLVSLGYDSATAWTMTQVTPMIGLNDTTSEVFTLANAHTLYAFAKDNTHPVPLLAIWALSRDKSCTDVGVSVNCSSADPSGKAVQTSDYQFSKILNGAA